MTEVVLRRFANTEDGVFGKMYLPNLPVLYTMEEDWKENQPNISCIPAGVYELRRIFSPKHQCEVFQVMNVPGRNMIEIHIANTEEDVEGCIGIGLYPCEIKRADEDQTGHPQRFKRAVCQSRAAFNRFMKYMTGRNTARLTVEWAPGVLHD